eukprot:6196783-Pleurochrysis_carterae.AAC.1
MHRPYHSSVEPYRKRVFGCLSMCPTSACACASGQTAARRAAEDAALSAQRAAARAEEQQVALCTCSRSGCYSQSSALLGGVISFDFVASGLLLIDRRPGPCKGGRLRVAAASLRFSRGFCESDQVSCMEAVAQGCRCLAEADSESRGPVDQTFLQSRSMQRIQCSASDSVCTWVPTYQRNVFSC